MPLTGSTSFHLTVADWTSSGVTPAQLLARIKGELGYFAPTQSANGQFPDQVTGVATSRVTSEFAYGGAMMASLGDTTYLSQAIKAMDAATANYFSSSTANSTDGVEFNLAPLVKAYTLFKASGLVPSAHLAQWAADLSVFHDTPTQLDTNWSTFAMNGAWLQYKAGLVSHATAVSEIENIWTTYQQYRENSSTDGLYVDATPTPDSLSVEVVGRGNITALVTGGYDGPSAGAMAAATLQGGANSLLMQDPSGQVPTGGRTDDHVFADAGSEALDQALANFYAQSNPQLAAQYQRAADLSFVEMGRWQQSDGSFSVTKNQFPASERVGYQQASQVSIYNADLLASTTDAYQASVSGGVSEQAARSEIGGYIYTPPATFAATFANAGGTEIEIETVGRSTSLYGQSWNALGIDRIGRTGWDTRLGPSDGIYNLNNGVGVTFAPTWMSGGKWVHLADNASTYHGTVTPILATPTLTILSVLWSPNSGGGPSFTQKLTITADGILSQTTESGVSGGWGMTLPIMLDDGATTMTQSIANGIASSYYPGGGSTENFIALNSDAALAAETAIQSAYGDITPVRATSSASEQDTFVYPTALGDPSAASVRSSFQITANGYTSNLGWVNGTLYSGRLSAGGYGSSIALSGSGAPDVVFSAPVTFILQIRGGVITEVETDTAVTATIEGVGYTLQAYTPLAVASAPKPTPSINVAALGTVAEATPGAGVTLTEAIATTGLTGVVYAAVMTASGGMESAFQPVSLNASGQATLSVHLAQSGDYVLVEDSVGSPRVSTRSTPVTITAAASPYPVAVAKPATLVAGQITFRGIVTQGNPSVVKFAWHAQPTGETASSADMVVATKQADGSYTASVLVDHVGQTGYFYVAVDGQVSLEWSAVPVASAPTPTISLAALGTVREPVPGGGVTITETVTTTGLTGVIYEEVVTANGSVETAFQAVTLGSGGQAAFSVHLANSGDYIVAVDNVSAPTVSASSTPVTITDPPLTTIVSRGVTSSGLVVASGGIELVLPGGSAVATAVQSGGALVVISGGVESATTVQPGGSLIETGVISYGASGSVGLDGAAASGLGIDSGGTVFVLSNGATTATHVGNGGQEIVFAGGSASGTAVGSGGRQTISAGGVARATTVSSGGMLQVSAGGLTTAAQLSGGGEYVSSGGVANATVVGASVLRVLAGGFASATSINAGGYAFVSASGNTSATMVGNGGSERVYSGGTASGTVVQNGGTQSVLLGGAAIGAIVNGGGFQYVSSGGTASATSINSGGTEYVFSGGDATASVVSSGSQRVSAGGLASGTTLLGGGNGQVFVGGTASSTVVSAGATEFVYSGGIDVATVVSSGGMEFIFGGVVSGATVVAGGAMTVGFAGIVKGGLVLSGGDAVISGSAAAGQSVTLAGAGNDLTLNNLGGFGAAIAGFGSGDAIDLATFAYGSGTTLSFNEAQGATSGTLTVANAGKAAHLTFVGSYAASNFVVGGDGGAGTLIRPM